MQIGTVVQYQQDWQRQFFYSSLGTAKTVKPLGRFSDFLTPLESAQFFSAHHENWTAERPCRAHEDAEDQTKNALKTAEIFAKSAPSAKNKVP